MSPEWLSLIEYRNKYDVSVSTLRRRIREDAIKFQLLRGKYFVFDEPIESKTESTTYIDATIKEHLIEPQIADSVEEGSSPSSVLATPSSSASEPVSSDVMILLSEVKSAYQKILKEKEEQIYLLREELVNQQTLIRILEEENQRLRRN